MPRTSRQTLELRIFAFAILGAVLCLPAPRLHGETGATSLVKFDEFGDLSADDQQARLDNYAFQLNKMEKAVGFIVFHRAQDVLPGWRLREVYGFQNYLVNSRGVDPRRLTIIEADVADKNITELWIAPREASAPGGTTTLQKLVEATQFDSLTLGDGCVGEYTLVLEEPADALKFFAAALNENPEAKGFVLVHPATHGSLRNVKEMTASSSAALITKYQISADRLVSKIEAARSCAEIDLWLAPASTDIPESTSPGPFFQAELMAEAEREHYTVRRIELLGNTYTKDETIRRRFLQNEGNIFQSRLLEQSLRNVSELRSLRPVSIQDVEVQLNRSEKTIDFVIYLNEPVRKRRRSSS